MTSRTNEVLCDCTYHHLPSKPADLNNQDVGASKRMHEIGCYGEELDKQMRRDAMLRAGPSYLRRLRPRFIIVYTDDSDSESLPDAPRPANSLPPSMFVTMEGYHNRLFHAKQQVASVSECAGSNAPAPSSFRISIRSSSATPPVRPQIYPHHFHNHVATHYNMKTYVLIMLLYLSSYFI